MDMKKTLQSFSACDTSCEYTKYFSGGLDDKLYKELETILVYEFEKRYGKAESRRQFPGKVTTVGFLWTFALLNGVGDVSKPPPMKVVRELIEDKSKWKDEYILWLL